MTTGNFAIYQQLHDGSPPIPPAAKRKSQPVPSQKRRPPPPPKPEEPLLDSLVEDDDDTGDREHKTFAFEPNNMRRNLQQYYYSRAPNRLSLGILLGFAVVVGWLLALSIYAWWWLGVATPPPPSAPSSRFTTQWNRELQFNLSMAQTRYDLLVAEIRQQNIRWYDVCCAGDREDATGIIECGSSTGLICQFFPQRGIVHILAKRVAKTTLSCTLYWYSTPKTE